ncbi:DNA-binding protein Ikaros-like [Coccinella septempunctata]|uniref:DNA-binding protein Ikaros-like n=1 Tax=Coccinella septempunctata TaxID=41139 RepID=UPI001D0953FF|nr:DNA-binding protein Ikaros-like [Coccinella septempunctata]
MISPINNVQIVHPVKLSLQQLSEFLDWMKRHTCPRCNQHFTHPCNFYRHKKQCGIEKKVKCDICDYRCHRKDSLKMHMVVRHQIL